MNLKLEVFRVTGNVDSMRKHLRSILALEKAGSRLLGKLDLNADAEILECDRKLVEIQHGIQAFNGSGTQGKKIETKFAHLMGRIGRIPETSEVTTKDRSKLLFSLSEFVPEYMNKTI